MSTLKLALEMARLSHKLGIEIGSAGIEMSTFWQTIAWNRMTGKIKTGNGHPIMILPGFTATDGSLYFLEKALKSLQYSPYTWGQGRNHGRFDELLEGILEVFFRIHEEHDGSPIEFIGWSKGGRMALKLANLLGSDLVSGVVTIGTPIWANSGRSIDDIPDFLLEGNHSVIDDIAGFLSQRLKQGLQEIKKDIRCILEELQTSAPMPPEDVRFTAIVGSADMVVPFEDAILPDELLGKNRQNQIVKLCSHLGLGLSGRTVVQIARHIQSDFERYYEEHEALAA